MGKWIFYQQCMCSRKNWTSTQMPVSPVTSATRTCIWHLWVASRLSSVPTNAILLVLFQCLIMHNFKFVKYNCTNNKAKIKSSRSNKIGHLQISWFRINPAVKLWGQSAENNASYKTWAHGHAFPSLDLLKGAAADSAMCTVHAEGSGTEHYMYCSPWSTFTQVGVIFCPCG